MILNRAIDWLRMRASKREIAARTADERGYTLFALLGLMALFMVALMAAAPNLRQQTQREREREAIYRGEEVAEAIRLYARYNQGRLPNSMDDLLAGVSVPGRTKKIQILRPSAARDPLSPEGEWLPVAPTDQALLEFQQNVTLYAGGATPPTRDPLLRRFAQTSVTQAGGQGLVSTQPGAARGGDAATTTPGSSPFIGVTSRSRRQAVLAYYGLEQHDLWLFTPLFR